MAGNNGRFVGCDHCTENMAGICGHCSGDHHGHECPTLRGVEPFTPEELEEIQERLSVTPGVIQGTAAPEPPDSRALVALLVRDYREIQSALKKPAWVSEWHGNDEAAALVILQIIYDTEVKE